MEHEHLFQGIHVLGEFYGIKQEHLDNPELLEALLRKGIEASGATLCGIQVKKFEPSGVTLLALLSESHASIHTYPGDGSLFFDAFTCGTTCEPSKIADALIAGLHPSHTELQTIRRGVPDRVPLELGDSPFLSRSTTN